MNRNSGFATSAFSYFNFDFFFFLLFRCSFEFGEEFQYDTVTTPEKLSEMLEKSPITHVKKVVPGRECLNSRKVHPSQPLPVCKGKDLGERLRRCLPENVYIFFCLKAVISSLSETTRILHLFIWESPTLLASPDFMWQFVSLGRYVGHETFS